MRFTKMEGLGNDFIVTHDIPSGEENRLVESAERLCDRRRGIGADGLVLVLPSRSSDFRMRIINSDGSEAEMCGNGIRCFAKYVALHSLKETTGLAIETLAGRMVTERSSNGMVRVNMQPPVLNAVQIPVNITGERVIGYPLLIDSREFRFTAVSMGNPHAVIHTGELTDELVLKVGPRIECHPLFPKKINVEFASVQSESEVCMRVWERGCGETQACGTGACAVAVAGMINGLHGHAVTVHLPGGDLFIEWGGNAADPVFMTGPANAVFSGTVPIPQ
ncbi:MAG: diaminopimelate epimerase [Chitinispirillaceae bacterium]|nr:diaminopimelate epimerase [Chitinispirillaceae bacterium]